MCENYALCAFDILQNISINVSHGYQTHYLGIANARYIEDNIQIKSFQSKIFSKVNDIIK